MNGLAQCWAHGAGHMVQALLMMVPSSAAAQVLTQRRGCPQLPRCPKQKGIVSFVKF